MLSTQLANASLLIRLRLSFAKEKKNVGFLPTFVRVPVLSEQMTETDPRVSTVFRDLHRILFFLIRFAVIVKLDVTAIGRPSGM